VPTPRGRVGFSAQGSFGFGAIPTPPRPTSTIGTAPRPAFTSQPRPIRPPPPRPASTTAAPLPTIRFGANGSVESSGPQHVNGVNKAADAANDRKMREYRQRVPW